MTEQIMIHLVSILSLFFVVLGIFRVIKSKNELTIPAIKIGIIALILCAYMSVISFAYRMYNADPNTHILLWMCKSVAKSFHFAANALTSASLVDSSGYTGDVLRWMEGMEAWVPYFSTGIIITIAPVFSAAWFVSLLNNGVVERLYLRIQPSIKCWVFYDSSEQSIRFAEELKKRLKRKEYIVFCRTNIYSGDITRKNINRIRNITNKYFAEDETSLSFQKKNHKLVMCVQKGSDISKYIDSIYHYPDYASELIVEAFDHKANLEEYFNQSKEISLEYLSYKDMIEMRLDNEIKSGNVFMIYNNEMATIAEKKYVGSVKLLDTNNYSSIYQKFSNFQFPKIEVVLATEKQDLIDNCIKDCKEIVKKAKVDGREKSIKIIVINENYSIDNAESVEGLNIVKIGTQKELIEEGVNSLFTQVATS